MFLKNFYPMSNNLINILNLARSKTSRFVKPRKNYFIFTNPQRSLRPVSKLYGFDRGTPIDRYYIEKFLENNKVLIYGRCLEIHDNFYTKKFGEERVTVSDVLDINPDNFQANIHGDLRNLSNIENETYDCLIVTHTLGIIDDYNSVVKECYRILKKGGYLLLTSSFIGPLYDKENTFWKFTPKSLDYIFSKIFLNSKAEITTYGNVLVCQCFLAGFSLEELKREELEYNDSNFPLVVCLKVRKSL